VLKTPFNAILVY